jgi:hypothetical protein
MLGPVPEDVRVGAVAWLRRAADVAMAGAANYEAARHLRSAIDLAHPEDLPELYERLGDVLAVGDEATTAYAEALRLARELGRPADRVLGLLASELLVWTRWAGSVASARSGRVDELIAEGESLLPATDPGQFGAAAPNSSRHDSTPSTVTSGRSRERQPSRVIRKR